MNSPVFVILSNAKNLKVKSGNALKMGHFTYVQCDKRKKTGLPEFRFLRKAEQNCLELKGTLSCLETCHSERSEESHKIMGLFAKALRKRVHFKKRYHFANRRATRSGKVTQYVILNVVKNLIEKAATL